MIAQELIRYNDSVGLDNFVIFAAGVSNSLCLDDEDFSRERRLIEVTCQKLTKNQKIVYLSTTAAYFYPEGASQYVDHKRAVEKILLANSDCLIVRLPQVVGLGGNKSNLCNWIYDSIRSGRIMHLYSRLSRNLIDVRDMAAILISYLSLASSTDRLITISNPGSILIADLVSEFESILEVKAKYVSVKGGFDYSDDDNISLDNTFLGGVNFNNDYVKRTLNFYYSDSNNSQGF